MLTIISVILSDLVGKLKSEKSGIESLATGF